MIVCIQLPTCASSGEIANRRISRNILPKMLASALVELPFELIRLITLHTVEAPNDRAQIMSLSQISRTWRAAVLGISKLFVSADWVRWPKELLDEWCLRARQQPLNVYMRVKWQGGVGYNALARACLHVSSHATQLGTINIFSTGYWHGRKLAQLLTQLFSHSMPRLQRLYVLSYHSPGEGTFSISAENVPQLRALYTAGVNPYTLESLDITHFGCAPKRPLQWAAWVGLLTRHSAMTHLTFDTSGDFSLPAISPTDPPLSLPSLTSLRLVHFDEMDDFKVSALLRFLVAPNLQSLELHNISSSLVQSVIKSMVR